MDVAADPNPTLREQRINSASYVTVSLGWTMQLSAA